MNQLAQASPGNLPLPEGYIQPPAPAPNAIPNQAGSGSALPPAGYQREEELKVRTDQLAEQADTLGQNVEAIDPNKIEPIPEIQREFDPSTGDIIITGRQAGFEYLWCYSGQNSTVVTLKRTLGWEPVQGNDPEALENKKESTLRVVGDTILMRIPTEQYERLRAWDRTKATAQQEGVSASLVEKAAKFGARIEVTGITGDESHLKRMQGQAFARGTANDAFVNHLQQGTVPGMPATPNR